MTIVLTDLEKKEGYVKDHSKQHKIRNQHCVLPVLYENVVTYISCIKEVLSSLSK